MNVWVGHLDILPSLRKGIPNPEIEMVDASQTIGFKIRRSGSSYIVSTSCNRVPHGQNIPGSIFVSIMGCPTIARPLSNRQWHLRLQHPADAAHLAAREPAVDLDHGLSVHRRFYFHGPDRLSDTGVAQAAGKAVVLDHAAQVEVFDADRVVSGNETPSQFLCHIASRVGNLFMHSRHALLLPLVAIRAFRFMRQDLLLAFQVPLVAVRVLRVRHPLTGGQRGKAVDSEVDTDRLAGFWQRRGRDIDNKRNEVASARLANHGYGRRVNGNMPGPPHFERPNLRQNQSLVADFEPEGGTGVFGGLLVILSLKRRVAGALVEEILECCLQVAQRLLRRHARHFVEPRKFRITFEHGQRSTGLVVVHALTALECRSALGEEPVVDKPHAAKRPGKMLFLLWRWVASECPSLLHAHKYNTLPVSQQHRRRAFLPALNAGVSSANAP